MRVLIIRLELFDVPTTLGHVLFCTGVLIVASTCALCYNLGDGSATRPGTLHLIDRCSGMLVFHRVQAWHN